jgi:nitroreductase
MLMEAAMAENILSSAPEFDYTERAPKINAREFQKVIDSRRSVRIFDRTPIPDKIMARCLENAVLAPNSSNLQPWEFYLVKNPEKRTALESACLGQVAAKSAADLVVVVARTATWKDHAREMVHIFSSSKTKVPRAAFSYYR